MQATNKKSFSTILKVLAILGIGIAITAVFILTTPKTERVQPPVSAPLVITISAERGNTPLYIEVLGTVTADQETSVRVQVSGQVEELGENFDVGGLLSAGEMLLRLDAEDYENALALNESALAKANADYSLEMGQQRVARTELEQLSRTISEVQYSSLALREPQLAQAAASVQSAEINVRQAELDLERTIINAPYNALVIERNVSIGSQASTSDVVAVLVGTDTFHVEAAIPLDKLQNLGMNTFNNAQASIYTATNSMREGNVRHSIAALDADTRMGRILVEIDDPLGLENGLQALLLGDHVRVALKAGELQNVISMPRVALRENNSVWIAVPQADDSYTLDIRTVDALWKDTDFAFVDTGLEEGELIIISPLGAPIQGMPLRLNISNSNAPNNIPNQEGSTDSSI